MVQVFNCMMRVRVKLFIRMVSVPGAYMERHFEVVMDKYNGSNDSPGPSKNEDSLIRLLATVGMVIEFLFRVRIIKRNDEFSQVGLDKIIDVLLSNGRDRDHTLYSIYSFIMNLGWWNYQLVCDGQADMKDINTEEKNVIVGMFGL